MGTFLVQWFLIGTVVTVVYGLVAPEEWEGVHPSGILVMALLEIIAWPYTGALIFRKLIEHLTPKGPK